MKKLTLLFAVIFALGIVYGCGNKKEEAKVEKPAETKMVKDVVCGMNVDPAKTTNTAEYEGETYHFCSSECKDKFVANPAQYVMASEGEHEAGEAHEHGEEHEHK